jgi:hypothetical protein
MKSRGWRLAQCFQWVKERRPQVQLADGNFIICAIFSAINVLRNFREKIRD